MNKRVLKKAFFATIPVMTGYLVLGAGFGIIMKTKGMGLLYTFLMSAFIYAGSMQFVAIDLLTAGASLITIGLTTLLVNARHLFYGISMIDKYKDAGRVKPYLIYALTDETYSLVVADHSYMDRSELRSFYFFVTLLDNIYWVTGGVIGSLAGSLITFNTEGLDFALTALFVTIFVEHWKTNRNHLSAVIGVVLSLVCLLIFGADNFLIPSMACITAVLLLVRRKEEPKYE
jgi:4-azaleucine resistance transporter AzlC